MIVRWNDEEIFTNGTELVLRGKTYELVEERTMTSTGMFIEVLVKLNSIVVATAMHWGGSEWVAHHFGVKDVGYQHPSKYVVIAQAITQEDK